MAADINDIVCLGFGSWSSVNWLPTLGFGIEIPAVPLSPVIRRGPTAAESSLRRSPSSDGSLRRSQHTDASLRRAVESK